MSAAFALLDAPGGGAWLFENLTRRLPLFADNAREQCREAERCAESGGHVVAALDYALGQVFEPRAAAAPSGRALGRFWVFSTRRHLDAGAITAWLSVRVGSPLPPATVLDFAPSLDAPGHAAAVRRIRDYIAAGDCYQVNFTFPFTGQCLGDPVALYARLRAVQPVAHGGLVVSDEGCILSLSPELFIERAAGVIRARPMKGTAARAPGGGDDAAARVALATSAKDRAENVMIVDLIRNDLGRIAHPGSVRVEAMCAIESYPTVHQMTSTVAADSDAAFVDVLAALFPCGSITGAPKVRAMQIIDELESKPRGHYTGALGWLGPGGTFSLNVAIRSLLIDPAGRVGYGVGSGIVWDSEPAAEYAECLLKAGCVTAADPGFRLIETLRLAEGRFPLLERHLDRIGASAHALSFACDRQAIAAALAELAAANPAGVHRVRLTLGRAGDLETTTAPLAALPSGMRAVIAARRLDSSNLWLRHKTTVREVYECELARLAAQPAVFDAVFLNERDEVCEGARSTVFVRMVPGAALLTPPLACGLLPGVLRRQLLASGEAVEAVLRVDDLCRAAEIYLGNALRGLVRVSLEAS